jgi:DNA replication protein DnaC
MVRVLSWTSKTTAADSQITESILDRVVNNAHHVAMEGKSYRPNKRPGTGGSKP